MEASCDNIIKVTSLDKMVWERKYSHGQIYLEYPDEMIVRCVQKHIQPKTHSKVLDLGCGTGRHSELLASKGFETHSCDISKNSVAITRNRLRSKGLNGKFSLFSHSWDLPFESDFFDVVIASHSIYYNTLKNLRRTIDEIRRILKKDGILITTFIGKRDYRQKHGRLISKNTYIGKETTKDHKGLTYCVFNNITDIRELIDGKLMEVSYGYNEWYLELDRRVCHWFLIAKK